jgi:hypothetical protein
MLLLHYSSWDGRCIQCALSFTGVSAYIWMLLDVTNYFVTGFTNSPVWYMVWYDLSSESGIGLWSVALSSWVYASGGLILCLGRFQTSLCLYSYSLFIEELTQTQNARYHDDLCVFSNVSVQQKGIVWVTRKTLDGVSVSVGKSTGGWRKR